MTIEPKALGAVSFSTSDLCHCPQCGSERQHRQGRRS